MNQCLKDLRGLMRLRVVEGEGPCSMMQVGVGLLYVCMYACMDVQVAKDWPRTQ